MTFESKYCPNDAKELNKEYEKHIDNYNEKLKTWNNHGKCLQKSKDIPDIIDRMKEFEKCGKKIEPPILIEQNDFFFNKFNKIPREHLTPLFRKRVVEHGIIDAYYLTNEEYLNRQSLNLPNDPQLCRQKDKLIDFYHILWCLSRHYKQ